MSLLVSVLPEAPRKRKQKTHRLEPPAEPNVYRCWAVPSDYYYTYHGLQRAWHCDQRYHYEAEAFEPDTHQVCCAI